MTGGGSTDFVLTMEESWIESCCGGTGGKDRGLVFSISVDFLDLLFNKMNTMNAATIKMEITIPAIAPPLIPDFFLLPLEPLADGVMLPLGWRV